MDKELAKRIYSHSEHLLEEKDNHVFFIDNNGRLGFVSGKGEYGFVDYIRDPNFQNNGIRVGEIRIGKSNVKWI